MRAVEAAVFNASKINRVGCRRAWGRKSKLHATRITSAVHVFLKHCTAVMRYQVPGLRAFCGLRGRAKRPCGEAGCGLRRRKQDEVVKAADVLPPCSRTCAGQMLNPISREDLADGVSC